MDGVVRDAIGSVLQDVQFQASKVDSWAGNVVEGCLKRPAGAGKPFKYIVTCNLAQKVGQYSQRPPTLPAAPAPPRRAPPSARRRWPQWDARGEKTRRPRGGGGGGGGGGGFGGGGGPRGTPAPPRPALPRSSPQPPRRRWWPQWRAVGCHGGGLSRKGLERGVGEGGAGVPSRASTSPPPLLRLRLRLRLRLLLLLLGPPSPSRLRCGAGGADWTAGARRSRCRGRPAHRLVAAVGADDGREAHRAVGEQQHVVHLHGVLAGGLSAAGRGEGEGRRGENGAGAGAPHLPFGYCITTTNSHHHTAMRRSQGAAGGFSPPAGGGGPSPPCRTGRPPPSLRPWPSCSAPARACPWTCGSPRPSWPR